MHGILVQVCERAVVAVLALSLQEETAMGGARVRGARTSALTLTLALPFCGSSWRTLRTRRLELFLSLGRDRGVAAVAAVSELAGALDVEVPARGLPPRARNPARNFRVGVVRRPDCKVALRLELFFSIGSRSTCSPCY